MEVLLQFLLSLFRKSPVKSEPSIVETPMSYKISEKEILKSSKREDLSSDYQKNLDILLERINKIRDAYNKSMSVTSGYRSMEDHLRIYKDKGITDQSKIPMKSKHLYCQAVDISDPKQELQKWCKDNVKTLEDIGLWCEDFAYTSNWTHFQIVPPQSGKRFFVP